ncbi:septation protein SepH [Pseudofrankia asymbiotica]|uniref:DUF3071 domain-containing protein n=1 Tax=Pseudofrankia asymbiotica TaxID=1834516 RepID=A0A1V2ID14_9ACTN|nr:septation protein SepH [Pseudofrankia asymbiotica]ONH30965.1 hypothetical protein BL253_11370 [Pseudofrankia asymbiotica]
MRELRAVALSEDGGYLVLADANGRADAEQFRVPVDDRLRAALRGARRSEVRTESALTPREIQARLRAGETAADVARAAGIPVERVERYEGPVLAERARVVQEARAALLPKDPGGATGRPLGEVVDTRLMAGQDDPEAAQWDAWRRVDGIWLVQLTSESRCARWTWDPVVRRVRPHDDAARALVAPEPVDAPPTASAAPGAATPAPTRQSPPALTLVQDPARPPAGGRPLPAHPATPQPEQRPRYAQPASYPEPGYPDSHDPAGPFPGPGQPAAPFPPAHQEPRYPAAHNPTAHNPAAQHPTARYPTAQHPAEHQSPAARQRADDFDHAAGQPADRYQVPPAYQRPQPPPEHYPPAMYSTDPYPPDTFAPAHHSAAPPHDGDLPAGRPDAPSPGSPYADGFGGPPSFDEAFNDPFDAGRAEPPGAAEAPPAAAAYQFPDRLAGGAGQPTADDLDLGRPFDPPAARPARPAAAHRPARPPALEQRPTRPLEPRRWQGHDDPDLGMGLDADLFDEPADQLHPPTPAASRPFPRPATAPPRGASAPPRTMPRSAVPPRPEVRATPQGPSRPAPNVPAAAFAPRTDARDAEPALGRPRETSWEAAAPQGEPAAARDGHDASPRERAAGPARPEPRVRPAVVPARDTQDARVSTAVQPPVDQAPREAAPAAPDGVPAQGTAVPAETAAEALAPVAGGTMAEESGHAPQPAPPAPRPVAATAATGSAAIGPSRLEPPSAAERVVVPAAPPAADEPVAEAQGDDVTAVTAAAAEEGVEASEPAPAEADVTKKTPTTASSRATAGRGTPKSTEKPDKTEKSAGKNQDSAPGSAATEGEEGATPQPSNRPRNAPRTGERSGGGRRGRKSVPAWDDIVFGARRP